MLKGFDSQIFDSQVVFRQMLTTMAKPGTPVDMGIDFVVPEILHPATGAILLTLLDFETPFWADLGNDSKDIQWIRFHTGAPITPAKQNSLFALCTNYENLEDPDLFNQGTIESPQHSTTLMIQTRGIDNKGPIKLTGPGIKKERFIKLKGIKESFWLKRAEIYKNYPLGIDMIFICDSTFVAIPRTSKVEIL